MSVLMGIQGGTRDKKFIPAACAQWGGIRHTGLLAAAIKAAVGSRMQASLLSCALFVLCCGCHGLDHGPGLPLLPLGRGRRQDMKMRFRKTPMSRRVSYCYESVTGEKFRISAEEYGAETVSLLHRMDDSEVRNNLSTGKPGIQKWQEEAARQWRERHPDEEPPKNWVLSLDSLTGEDGSGMADDSRYMKEAVDRAAQEEADPLKELLHECVEEMDGDSQRLYQRYYMEDAAQAEIAKEFGISQMAVSKRLKKLEAALKKECLKKLEKKF